MADPDIGARYRDFMENGYLRLERNMAMLRESSEPTARPNPSFGRDDSQRAKYVTWEEMGLVEYRRLGAHTFLMETEAGRKFEIANPDRDGDGDYDLSINFFFVHENDRENHWRAISPLSLLRGANLVRKNGNEWQWFDKDGQFKPFPEVGAVLEFQGSTGTPT